MRTVHIKEGQTVKPGDLLFSLDTRMDEANLDKARAQLMRDQGRPGRRAAHAGAQPGPAGAQLHLKSAVDTAQAKVDGFEATIRADQAAIEASRVAVSYGAIRATIGGRTGVINVFPARWSRPPAACRW